MGNTGSELAIFSNQEMLPAVRVGHQSNKMCLRNGCPELAGMVNQGLIQIKAQAV